MSNTQLELKDLSEKSAKAIAASVTKFLKSQGIALEHAKALDLTGTICGFADWQGLKAAVDEKARIEAATPVKLSYADFLEKFKPKLNGFDDNASADGFAFETYGDEFEAVQRAFERNPDTVWTCVESEGTSYIVEGLHFVNRMFYFITHKPAEKNVSYQIAYGHDEGDLHFEISVMNPETRISEVLDERYGSSAEEVFEDMGIDLSEEVAGVVEEFETRVILVKQID